MRSQKLAVATCAMGTLTVNMNNTALNLALPEIRDDLGLDFSTLQWVSAAYVLVLAAMTMLGGALGDRFDKRTVLAAGLVVYTVGSLLGSLADSGAMLIVGRVCAAIGASVLVPVGLAALRVMARTPKQLATYMSLWGLAIGLGMALGPVAGGVVTGLFGWRVFFAALSGLGVVFIAAVLTLLPRLPGTADRRIDVVGHALLGCGMFALTAFFIELRADAPVWVKAGLGGAVPVFAALWLWRDRRSASPVIPPQALGDRSFSVSMLVAFVNYLGLGATLFVSALLLQDFFGLSPVAAGLVSIPLAVATAAGAAWAGRADGTGQIIRAVRTAALATLVGTLVVGAATGGRGADVVLWACLALYIAGSCAMGFGFGAANTPVNYLAMASLPKTSSGAAGSSATASRQLGQSTGVATGGLLLGLGAAQVGTAAAPAYLLPGIEIVAAALVLLALPTFYGERRS